MWFPSLRSDDDFDLFDDVFNAPMFGRDHLMKTDVYEKDGKYVMEMDLPGIDKNNVKISLKDGNLTVNAEHRQNNDQKDNDGNMIRQERFYGSCSRTFYVGKDVKQSDVHASFHNGTLKIEVPSEKKAEPVDENHYIDIQ